MEIIKYTNMDETIYKEILPNGLTVRLLPKTDFYKTYALFSTNFGSIDQQFIPIGETDFVKMPGGIAHFLEHKMFENENGDVFDDFSHFGASANALTSFTKTAYLFSSTSHFKENLVTLLDFVQQPYFTNESVNKEKGIIGQEIQMYDDLPEWRVMFGLLENLYPNHPASVDIAGTVESIKDINAALLYNNYQTFYHPHNMQLFITGNFELEQTIEWIRQNQNQKNFNEFQEIKRKFPSEEETKVIPRGEIKLPISKPKVLVGIKGKKHHLNGEAALRQLICIEFLLKLLFGETSSTYLKLYDEGLIDDSFNYEYTFEREIDYLSVGGDTKEPEQLINILKNLLLTIENNPDMNEKHFEIVKKSSIGEILQSFNSLEFIAHQFSDLQFENVTIFDIVPLMESIELKDIEKMAVQYIHKENMSEFRVLPKSK
ncbi:peptidase, M16 family [Marinilactibacillus psychrotolerans 42ea]|uniref:Peptidase, M16 family n=1 Tax=Marinilactibacillus psychrotolerans 42ea TaxID=1255609 RepID=A0A1R4JEM1_9LACT|nr:pitrilysin family protein [Marinilactibacillus psychrotolerans]SJN30203.1 peptidase, M16 family [Marinilactibacillus psychrotolerans 42ea]